MVRFFFFLTGFGIAIVGGVSYVAYLNLLAIGLTLEEYILFMLLKKESYLLPLGVIMVASSLYIPQNEIPIFRDKE